MFAGDVGAHTFSWKQLQRLVEAHAIELWCLCCLRGGSLASGTAPNSSACMHMRMFNSKVMWIGLKRGCKFIHSHVAGIGFWIHDTKVVLLLLQQRHLDAEPSRSH